MNAAHSIPQAFLCAAYRFLSPGPRSTAVELQREDSSLEWRWKMRSSDGGKMKSQEEQRGLFTSSIQAWHAATPIVGHVLQYESPEDYEHQGECFVKLFGNALCCLLCSITHIPSLIPWSPCLSERDVHARELSAFHCFVNLQMRGGVVTMCAKSLFDFLTQLLVFLLSSSMEG